MPFVFPIHLLNPTNVKSSKGRRVVSGGVAISGAEDVVETDFGGYRTVTLSGINLYSPELQRLWNAWDSHLGAGGVECWLPVPSIYASPRPSAGGRRMTPSNLTITGEKFFPTNVYRASPYIIAVTTAAALMNATSLAIRVVQGARVQGGETFSIMHGDGPCIYDIERVVSSSEQSAVVRIWPPLRDDVVKASPLNFDWPMTRARLQPGYDMSAEIQYGRISEAQAIFVEATGDA